MKQSSRKNYNTVGMRFLNGPRLANVYTYRIRKGARVHLGQELVVPTPNGTSIAVVVELHKVPPDNGPYDYKFVTGKIARL